MLMCDVRNYSLLNGYMCDCQTNSPAGLLKLLSDLIKSPCHIHARTHKRLADLR